MEIWIFVLPWFTSLCLLHLKMNPVILIMVAIPFFWKNEQTQSLDQWFFSCGVYWIVSLISLQCFKMKLESLIQSTIWYIYLRTANADVFLLMLLLLLLLSLYTCRHYNSLYYVGLCKSIFIRVFLSRVLFAFIGWEFFDRKMFLHV